MIAAPQHGIQAVKPRGLGHQGQMEVSSKGAGDRRKRAPTHIFIKSLGGLKPGTTIPLPYGDLTGLSTVLQKRDPWFASTTAYTQSIRQ